LAEFLAPGTGIDFYNQLKLTKIADWRHHKLEKKVLEAASAVTVISKQMQNDFNSIVPRQYNIITNGFDEDDIYPLPSKQLDTKFSISHIGSINASRNPAILWKVLAQMIHEDSEFAAALQVKLVGKADFSVSESIEANKLSKFVTFTEYLPHADVMLEIQKSQVQLLLINNIPNAKGILTGKIFEYLGSGRPILCIGPEQGDASDLLSECRAGFTADYNNETGLRKIITHYYALYCKKELVSQSKMHLKFSRNALTSEIALILDKIQAPNI